MGTRFRRLVAVLLMLTSVEAHADDEWLVQTRNTLVEAGDTVGSFWAPFGITVGGVAASGLGAVLLGVGAQPVMTPRPQVGDYALFASGAVVLGGGLTLLTLGIIKFVQRRMRLSEAYGH
jgi:hypothetical protein